MLNFNSVDDGRSALSNVAHDVLVTGPSTPALRIDHKMGYQRLLEEASEAGLQLHVVHKDAEYDVYAAVASRED